jgi:hypothetical protein
MGTQWGKFMPRYLAIGILNVWLLKIYFGRDKNSLFW